MMQDYKFRQSSTPAPARRGRRGSLFVRALILLLSIGVLALIAMSVPDLWPDGVFAPETEDASELMPLPLPPHSNAQAD